jgi:hypothetical protein
MTLQVNWREMGARDGSSPQDGYAWKAGGSHKRTIRVRWADRFLAMRQAVGFSYPTYEGGIRRLRREIPEGHQEDRTLFCTNADVVRGLTWTGRSAYRTDNYQLLDGYPSSRPGDANGDRFLKANEFNWAVISLTFAQADFSIRTDDEAWYTFQGNELCRFVSYREERSASYITMRGGLLWYIIPGVTDEARRQIPFATGRIELSSAVYLKWHQVAVDAVPFATLDYLVGKTNKYAYLNKAAGTLLFLPPKIEHYTMSNGLLGADVTVCLTFAPQGQNKLLQQIANTQGVYRWVARFGSITQEPTPGQLPPGQFLYDEADLAASFQSANF